MRFEYTTGLAVAGDDKPPVDQAALDKAFDALTTFDWGADRNALKPIDEAVTAPGGDAAARKALETRLAAVLKTGASRAAKDFVCRKLTVIGTAESAPALAGLLTDKDLSHMARYALERMPAPEAAQAMREVLPKVNGAVKAGVIGSLGVRRDAASVKALAAALLDADAAVAGAAACALGNIAAPEAAKVLGEFAPKAPEGVKPAAADACLACAERLLADGKKAEATALYQSLNGAPQSSYVRQAATRGLTAVAEKKD
jgi:HEAT repeat protein